MAKIKISITVDEDQLERVQALARRMRWSFSGATQLAFDLLLEQFEGVTIPGLTTEPSPEVEPAEVTQ